MTYDPGAKLPTTVQILNGEKSSNVGAVLMERPPLWERIVDAVGCSGCGAQ